MESLRSKSCAEGAGAAEEQAIQGQVAEALLEAQCLIHSLRQDVSSGSEQGHTDDHEMQVISEPEEIQLFEEEASELFEGEGAAPEAGELRQSVWSEDREAARESGSEELRPDEAQQDDPVVQGPAKLAKTSARVGSRAKAMALRSGFLLQGFKRPSVYRASR